MNSFELRATLSLSGLFALRLLGVFMILPVFSPYASGLVGATPFLVGMSLGIYGLMQACLQIPFGFYSDKVGRRPIIFLGLSLFIVGSLILALSTSIYGVLIGRTLQGAAAVGSVILALLSDLTRPEGRSQSMAILGITLALTFMLSLMLGPLVASLVGVRFLFWITAGLGIGGILLLYYGVPNSPPEEGWQPKADGVVDFKTLLKNKALLKLDFGIFILHAIFTAVFLVLPVLLQGQSGVVPWKIYLIVTLLAFVFALPFIRFVEKHHKIKPCMHLSLMALVLSLLGFLLFPHTLVILSFFLWLFLTAFTLLEAILPSQVSKLAPIEAKGSALGIYSTLQFLGIFIGGIGAGVLWAHLGIAAVFGFGLIFVLIWAWIE